MTNGKEWAARIRGEVQKAIIGQDEVIERLLVALLANGHVLLEGLPGLAKTLLIKSLGSAMGLDFERIQFTPDLLPSDVVGTMVFQPKEGTFRVSSRPVFANLVLADENQPLRQPRFKALCSKRCRRDRSRLEEKRITCPSLSL